MLIKLPTFQRALRSVSLVRLGDKIGICYDQCIGLYWTVRGTVKYTPGVWVKRYLVPVEFYVCKLVTCECNEADTAEFRKQNSVLFLRPDENEQEVNGQYEYHRQPKCTVQQTP
jgi:hypothetical protein